MTRTFITLERKLDDGRIDRIRMMQDVYENGDITYDEQVTRTFNDGNEALILYNDLKSADNANSTFKSHIANGFTVVDGNVFAPSEMDMR